MTRVKLSKVLEVAKYLAKPEGKALSDFIQYVADLADQVIRTLRNGITFADNVDAKRMTVTLVDSVAQIINTDGRRPYSILAAQVQSTVYGIDSLAWWIDQSGQTTVKVRFTVPEAFAVSWVRATNVVTVTSYNHGLSAGMTLTAMNSFGSTDPVLDGSYVVTAVPSANSFTFTSADSDDASGNLLSYRASVQLSVALLVCYG